MERIVGYRFHPTDNELIEHYVNGKNFGREFSAEAPINVVDICDHEPWELPGMAKIKSEEDGEWYFYTKPVMKYSNCKTITKRCTKSGSWKPTGETKEVIEKGKKIGIKKFLAFKKRGPKETEKTNWVMHEYHSSTTFASNGTPYVLCKVKLKDDKEDAKSTISQTRQNSFVSSSQISSQTPYVVCKGKLEDAISTIPSTWELGQTSHNSSYTSSQIPPQANHEVYQPAADQSVFNFESALDQLGDYDLFDDFEELGSLEDLGLGEIPDDWVSVPSGIIDQIPDDTFRF